MKKIISLLALVLLLTGCSDARANVSSRSTVLLTVGKENVTRGEVFSTFMNSYPGETVISMATRIILDKEIPVDATIKATADAALKDGKGNWKDEFETYYVSQCFENENNYYNRSLVVYTKFFT